MSRYNRFTEPAREILHGQDLGYVAPFDRLLDFIVERLRDDQTELAIYRSVPTGGTVADAIDAALESAFGVTPRKD